MLRETKSINKLANVFAWLNWIISIICIVFFVAVLVFAFLKVDGKWGDKIYALLIMFLVTVFPAAFFFLNGLIIKSKYSVNASDTQREDDF